jgi:hydroxyethylthiazole kinase-like uncharacterized protein yjeF
VHPTSSTILATITPRLLRRWPLPQPEAEADKEERGRILVVGGAPEMPGAVILAATAALRAGAGKLRIATCRSVAPFVAATVPEARVKALPETPSGAIDPAAASEIAGFAEGTQAVVIGPGLIDREATEGLVARLVPHLQATVVLDAVAQAAVGADPDLLRGRATGAIVTPHATEMVALLGGAEDEVGADPAASALGAARRLAVVVVLKGATTHVAGPSGARYRNRTGNVGLATSGSGDVLAGIVAGLAARGADPLQAAVWGVYLHGRAGDRLAGRVAPLGFLARELPAEIPPLLAGLAPR